MITLTKLEADCLVDKIEFPESPKGCWLWTAAKNGKGYGQVKFRGTQTGAHRLAYLHWIGPIPKGLQLDHLCRNPSCVNPNHLEAVTQKTNMLRGESPSALNAQKTHCKRGHALDGPNLRLGSKGRRMCRTCIGASRRATYAQIKLEMTERGESWAQHWDRKRAEKATCVTA